MMSKLVFIYCDNVKEKIEKHSDEMKPFLKQLRTMGTNLEDLLRREILIASIEALRLDPITADIKMLSNWNVFWEDVTVQVVEKHELIKFNYEIENCACAGK